MHIIGDREAKQDLPSALSWNHYTLHTEAWSQCFAKCPFRPSLDRVPGRFCLLFDRLSDHLQRKCLHPSCAPLSPRCRAARRQRRRLPGAPRAAASAPPWPPEARRRPSPQTATQSQSPRALRTDRRANQSAKMSGEPVKGRVKTGTSHSTGSLHSTGAAGPRARPVVCQVIG